ncbi:MAG TPA: phosphocholine cytidylyltransferase family protein [Kofleriaceae bacterium]|nr:phosphocholine cytidylyltransferase family protein [Kofleriaceae bacterium]
MRAVILTAGGATRLRPLTELTPKCLLPVAGRQILRRAVDTLLSVGMTELVVVTGYRAGQVRRALESWFPGLAVTFVDNPAWARTNNADSLYLAGPATCGEPFLLLDGDIVFHAETVRQLLDHGQTCLALRAVGDIGLEEVKVRAGAGGRIDAIGKDVPVPEACGESVGIELFTAEDGARLFAVLGERIVARGQIGEYYEAAFQEMLDSGTVMTAVAMNHDAGAYAMEIDTARDLSAAEALVTAAEIAATEPVSEVA